MMEAEERARYGQEVRRQRAAKGWTLEHAAASADLSSTTWRAVEHGRPVGKRTYAKVEQLFAEPLSPQVPDVHVGEVQHSFTAAVLRRYADGLNTSQVDEYTDSDESWNRALGSVRDDLRALASRVEQVESSTLSRLFGGA